jgi:hypothetical protein
MEVQMIKMLGQRRGLELRKGENIIFLPVPVLSNNTLLLVSLTPSLFREGSLTSSLPITVWGKEACAEGAIPLIIKTKEATTYSGPLANYYLLSDR